ncbi:MAG: hypothetical protein DCC75_08290, partial [Proteobacteria bacterium]
MILLRDFQNGKFFLCQALLSPACVLLAFSLLLISGADARPRSWAAEFTTPAGLRARVNFWRDIFTKYGKNQSVIHHRDYPQVVFDTADFSRQAAVLNPVALDSLKRREVKSRIAAVNASLTRLGQGKVPENALERQIVEEMAFIPGGAAKYRKAVKDDLVRSQTGIKEKFADAISRSGRYLPIIEEIFIQKYSLPIQLTRLPFVESSFDYQAYSSVGAAGIWQFMPRTARLYMTVNSLIDERRDPIKSTEAAAQYLLSAHAKIGTWPLALTSYNHGVGGVLKKMKQFGTSDIVSMIETHGERPFGFASSNFYPSFLAALEVYNERHIHFPNLRMEPALDITQYRLPYSVSVSHVVKQLGIDESELRSVNYAISDQIWRGRAKIPSGYVLKIPSNYAPRLAQLGGPEVVIQAAAPPASSIYGGATYKVRKGDTLSGVAKKFSLSTTELKQLNNLSGDVLGIGQVLVVKRRETGRETEVGVTASESSERREEKTYTVQKGD